MLLFRTCGERKFRGMYDREGMRMGVFKSTRYGIPGDGPKISHQVLAADSSAQQERS